MTSKIKSTVITAVEDTVYDGPNLKIFLAGGISNCPDWQSFIIDSLKYEDVVLFNPRRPNFPMDEPGAAAEQIEWEYNKLKEADMIIFWFSKATLNPIVLYELGRWGNSSDKPIIVGIEPEYERLVDVVKQTDLSRPDVPIKFNLLDLSNEIKKYLRETKLSQEKDRTV